MTSIQFPTISSAHCVISVGPKVNPHSSPAPVFLPDLVNFAIVSTPEQATLTASTRGADHPIVSIIDTTGSVRQAGGDPAYNAPLTRKELLGSAKNLRACAAALAEPKAKSSVRSLAASWVKIAKSRPQ